MVDKIKKGAMAGALGLGLSMGAMADEPASADPGADVNKSQAVQSVQSIHPSYGQLDTPATEYTTTKHHKVASDIIKMMYDSAKFERDEYEKLLQKDYLKELTIEEDLRDLLKEYDRETASIKMGVEVAKRKYTETRDLQISIDCGLRVGLAILTEAVLVAPLEGIGEVRIMNNEDGSEFLSIDFCGPIRAAGGTAQALGVLIGDMIRRELGVGRYIPSTREVERVKEEFGLYRVGLQYKPPPDEIETIVRACPVMINGEETERNECAGFKEVRNVVNLSLIHI